MIVINNLEEIQNIPPCCIALGNFDGVHVGHQTLIAKAVEKAHELGIHSAVFTFSNHPKNLLFAETWATHRPACCSMLRHRNYWN